MKKSTLLILMAVSTFLFMSCGNKQEAAGDGKLSLAVFVPGVLAGSPTYEMMDKGVRKAASEFDNVSVKTIEGGYNQGEWLSQVTALAASKEYDIIFTSNPSLPELCAEAQKSYPDQKFVIWDGYRENQPNMATMRFNDRELAFLLGHLARQITQGQMPLANPDQKIGLIVGQEYPVMNGAIIPGFKQGVLALGEGTEVDIRVVGNWYDAGKATELANSMFDSGVDVILTIAGGANQGVVAAAKERGKYVLWYNTDGYSIDSHIVGSGLLLADKAAYEWTKKALEGTLEYNKAITVGVKEGYIDFISDNKNYIKQVSPEIQQAQSQLMDRLKKGELTLSMPKL
ncbi:BMP family ABC transporter substrate-binding protein [Spirochaeta cellobiosiphila]|uniref:BMP family ABC transporter substrate-binding protein n=1 Tax=Spirochaeta cellobiosiphila TaxID=504483 RepID=UPI000423752D|nr:BMP family ABC transporter substrate-binding protein [Spirochaeta cellobiosiphila]